DAGKRVPQVVRDDAEHMIPLGHGPLQRLLDTLAFGDVAKHDREQRHAAHDDFRNRGFEWKLLAVAAKAADVLPLRNLAGGLIAGGELLEVSAMDVTQPFGNQHVERFPDHLAAGISEDALRALV